MRYLGKNQKRISGDQANVFQFYFTNNGVEKWRKKTKILFENNIENRKKIQFSNLNIHFNRPSNVGLDFRCDKTFI